MTLIDLCNDHARRVAQVTRFWAYGWISDEARIRYLTYEEEITEALSDQVVDEAHY